MTTEFKELLASLWNNTDLETTPCENIAIEVVNFKTGFDQCIANLLNGKAIEFVNHPDPFGIGYNAAVEIIQRNKHL